MRAVAAALALAAALVAGAPAGAATAPTLDLSDPVCAEGAQQAADHGDFLAAAYDFDSLYAQDALGQGVTIALLEEQELTDGARADYTRFLACYGLDPGRVTARHVPPQPGGNTTYVPGVSELVLDVEIAALLAPQADIVVYYGPDTDSILARLIADGPPVVSSSFDRCEPNPTAELDLVATLAARATVFQSAGDYGAEACLSTGGGDGLAVNGKAAVPAVTAVGGTTLTPDPAAPIRPFTEGLWNGTLAGGAGGSGGAGGGGLSVVHPLPAWQQSVLQPENAATCGGAYCRQVPDVSALANPGPANGVTGGGHTIYEDGAWHGNGGTSAAAPLWAALAAVVMSSPACANRLPLGPINESLYALGADPASGALNDIGLPSGGNNAMSGANDDLYPVKPGYGLATGLGTPNGGALAAGLCRRARPRPLPPPAAGPPCRVRGTLRGRGVDVAIPARTLAPGRRATVHVRLPRAARARWRAAGRRSVVLSLKLATTAPDGVVLRTAARVRVDLRRRS